MGLKEYRRKRRFDVTPEPSDDAPIPKGKRGLSYCVQRHDATRLHYDFRLEWDGVLKSWAVPKGPSFDPDEKRLAVMTEDHPIAYGGFEGEIPAGEYGGGPVLLWDRGTWTPEGDVDRMLKKGHLKFRLNGEKLAGGWHLVRLPESRDPGKTDWLLFKSKDDAARPGSGDAILQERPESVLTGRKAKAKAAKIFADLPDAPPRPGRENARLKARIRAAVERGQGRAGVRRRGKTADASEAPRTTPARS
ncbi:MAG TPA: DNA polymerase ligase N-terminal domain-containing protein, partial [Planctomycetota bacterium]|nr:DNA polymerase ligase N-terminal domain-containing protein [Planctomycetota bacterium]